MTERWYRYGIGLLFTLCVLACAIRLSAFAVTQQVVLVAEKEVYLAGEELQLQARLVPPREGVSWVWECRLPGEEESTVICTEDKLTVVLTARHHGAVLCPVAILADGTVVRGTEKTLTVELACEGLEIGKLPAKTDYAPGEAFDPAGLQVLARMSDGSRRDVTDRCSYAPLVLTLDTKQVLVSCRLWSETGALKDFGCCIPLTVKLPEQTDMPGGTENAGSEGASPDSGPQQKPGSGNAADGAADTDPVPQRPASPDKQPLQAEPLWSAPTRGGVILGIGLLLLCGGMAAALWWLLRGARQQDRRDPPAS